MYLWPSGVIGMLEREQNLVNLVHVCPNLKLLLPIFQHIFGDENLEYGVLTLWIGIWTRLQRRV